MLGYLLVEDVTRLELPGEHAEDLFLEAIEAARGVA
jgi:hypothetical protein